MSAEPTAELTEAATTKRRALRRRKRERNDIYALRVFTHEMRDQDAHIIRAALGWLWSYYTREHGLGVRR